MIRASSTRDTAYRTLRRFVLVAPLVVALVLAPLPSSAEPPRGASEQIVRLPATGQTEAYPADLAGDDAGPVAVPDDGQLRTGAPLRYRDNGDGTISDLTTGLMWEKKCAGCEELHDVGSTFAWSGNGENETIWDWLVRLNAEGEHGFAGHSDWRIPNITELISILDYGAADPAVSDDFNGESCEDDCPDPTKAGCSCTDSEEYWTSTTFADFPAHAYAVYFGVGLVNDRVKTNTLRVRAVRGGHEG